MQTHSRVQMEKNKCFKIDLEVLISMPIILYSSFKFAPFISINTWQLPRCRFMIQKKHSLFSEKKYCNIVGAYKKAHGNEASFLF